MAVSPMIFPSRRRRLPSPTSFLSPQLTPLELINSLHCLASDISLLEPPRHLLRCNSTSLIRKCSIISTIFHDLTIINNNNKTKSMLSIFSISSLLCFEEMFILLERIKALIEDCCNGSKMLLVMQIEEISTCFHELTHDLLTLLEIIPLKELNLSDDISELRDLAIKQCRDTKLPCVDPNDQRLRHQVLHMLDLIRREIIPDHAQLAVVFDKIKLSDSVDCREEIELLHDEIQFHIDEKSRSNLMGLIGLVRYGKCVLYGASSSHDSDDQKMRSSSISDLSIPSDYRCPISLELMTDPVVIATGQTYDRVSIMLWFESGHKTCPKTGQSVSDTNLLIPNRALKSLISMWCREHRIPYVVDNVNDRPNDQIVCNKAAIEATKMMVSFLLDKLVENSDSIEVINRILYELRVLAKTDSDSRVFIGQARVVAQLIKYLGSDNPSLQVNAVTTMLNLSILEENKAKIMEADGALHGVIEVLRSGIKWEAKGNAAATVFSLCGVSAYRKKLGKKTRVVKGLVELAREGPTSCKKDALVAILALASDRETAGRFVENGVVDMIKQVMDELPEETMTLLEVVIKKGGLIAIVATSHMIPKLVNVLRNGSDRAKESVVATLVLICRKGGGEMVSELAKITTIEIAIWEMMGVGTARAKRKAASLMRILRRWAAGLEGDVLDEFSITMAIQ